MVLPFLLFGLFVMVGAAFFVIMFAYGSVQVFRERRKAKAEGQQNSYFGHLQPARTSFKPQSMSGLT
jgi:hypothetical protein